MSLADDNVVPMDVDHSYEETPVPVRIKTEPPSTDYDSPSVAQIIRRKNLLRRQQRKIKSLAKQYQSRSSKNIKTETSSEPVKSRSKMCYFLISLLVLISAVSISFTIYLYEDFKFHNEKFRLVNIRDQFDRNVYHQNEATEIILKTLKKMVDSKWKSELFVLPFIGSSGVGKTYIANILKSNFYYTYVHDIMLQDLYDSNKVEELLNDLKYCCNLILIDNLKPGDIENVIEFVKQLPQSKVMLVIPIINVQDVSDMLNYNLNEEYYRTIPEMFKNSGVIYEAILFNVIERKHLENSMKDFMKEKEISYAQCGHLIEVILSNHDISSQGFKLLHNKLDVLVKCGEQNRPQQ